MAPSYTFIYDPVNGHPVADGKVQALLDSLPKSPDSGTVVFTSTMHVIDAVRLRIARDEMNHLDVMIRFNGKSYALNAYGNNPDFPLEFYLDSEYSTAVLLAQSKKLQAAHTRGER